MIPTFVGADTGGGNFANLNLSTTPCTWPAHLDGDVALLLWCGLNTVTYTTPPGFTLLEQQDRVSLRMMLWWRPCDGTESGDLSLAASAINRMSACLCVYRNASLRQPVTGDWAWRQEDTSGTTHANPALAIPVADCAVLAMVGERGAGSTAWTQPSGYTERADTDGLATGSGGTICAVADDGLASSRQAGTSVTPGVWTSGNGFATSTLQTVTFSLRPREQTGWGVAVR